MKLHIESIGVIETLDLVLSPGLTAFTGETGAGKTMLVEAINLLVGGRADPSIVRTGAAEARVEGRFVVGDDEVHRGKGDPDRWQVTRLCRRATGNRDDAGRVGGAHCRSARAARPPVPAVDGGTSATRSTDSARPTSNRCDAARARLTKSTHRWLRWVAISVHGPAKSTCCGSRLVSWLQRPSPMPTKTTADRRRRRAGRRRCASRGRRICARGVDRFWRPAATAAVDHIGAAIRARRSAAVRGLHLRLHALAAELTDVGHDLRPSPRARRGPAATRRDP